MFKRAQLRAAARIGSRIAQMSAILHIGGEIAAPIGRTIICAS
jgi:hypothetical protein